MTDRTTHGPSESSYIRPPAKAGAWSALHAGLGAILVGEDGRLLDANTTALDALGLTPADVGIRVDVRLAQIAIRHEFGPTNGVVAHCSEGTDDHLGARCVPMGAAGSATTLYLLWDQEAIAKLLGPDGHQ